MSILNLDEMLGQSLDAVVAAPDFITPENGVYVLAVKDTKAEKKDVKDKAAAEKEGKPTAYVALTFTYEIKDIIEQEGQPIKPGSLFSERFTVTEQGLPYFKSRVAAIAVASGSSAEDVDGLSIKEALEAVKTLEFKTNIKQNVRKVNDGTITDIRMNNIRPVDSE